MALFDDIEAPDGDALFDEVDAAASAAGGDATEQPGLLPPQQNPLCLGHEATEKTLLKLFNADRLPHAMIFSGPKGIGKATFAYRFARFLLSQDGDDSLFGGDDVACENFDLAEDHPVFRRVSSGGHADILSVGRVYDTKKGKLSQDIPVDEVRKITPFLRKTASDGGWRVVIVDEAEHLNRSSQNALLKILEEPPSKAVLVLITDQPGRFLPTIRSRCQSYHFEPLAEENMSQLLDIAAPASDDKTRTALKLLGAGRIGYALELFEQGGLQAYEDMLELLEKLPVVDSTYAYTLSEKLGRDKKVFPVYMDLLCEWLSKMARLQVRGQIPAPVTPAEGDVLSRLTEIYTPRDWLIRYEKISEIIQETERVNLDTRQAVLEVIWALEKNVKSKEQTT
jgi:DNA polymerase-3 subunit delta'